MLLFFILMFSLSLSLWKSKILCKLYNHLHPSLHTLPPPGPHPDPRACISRLRNILFHRCTLICWIVVYEKVFLPSTIYLMFITHFIDYKIIEFSCFLNPPLNFVRDRRGSKETTVWYFCFEWNSRLFKDRRAKYEGVGKKIT